MTNLRKAAEQALEALDAYSWEQVDAATNALRQALAQAEKQPIDLNALGIPHGTLFQPAQPEQELLGGEWVPCVKLPIVVHVRNQRDGETHISTREGITPVLPEDLIMRGVAGEEYPIGRELFERTYTFDVDAVNTSQERVDETAKREHEPEKEVTITCSCGAKFYIPLDELIRQLQEDKSQDFPKRFDTHLTPPKREWVGLTDEEIFRLSERIECCKYSICAAEEKLKEKNT